MMKHFVLILYALISSTRLCQVAIGRIHEPKGKEISQLLTKLLDCSRYDGRLRPNYGEGPVEVSVGFWILSIERIDVVNMDFTIDIFLRQQWTDKRLDHGLNHTITLSSRWAMKKIWVPDSYFVNAKTGRMHRVTTPNMMLMLGPGGVIKYNARTTIKAACLIDLRKFPMDSQVCPLVLESYGYSAEHIRYKWEVSGTDGHSFVPSEVRLMPNYELTNINLSLTMNIYVVGNFSGVCATFTFKRSYSYFLSHMYGTSSVIVAISWIGFVVPFEQTAARIALGITSLLTEVTILNMMNNSMPKVSYVKSSDKFLIGCFVFVFLTLIEYCVVLLLKAKQKQRSIKARKSAGKQQEKDEKCDHMEPKDWIRNGTLINTEECDIKFPHGSSRKATSEYSSRCTSATFRHTDVGALLPWEKSQMHCKTFIEQVEARILTDAFILSIDEYSFRVFPLAFAVYNACYWMDYL
ncbi:gamma-aminobutyric acid receptor subunit beta-1-like isoform X1 [Stylophora pistillata]|uniref:gamma-aminobutyric acid receptor subunit beta-1-like isoform X1 n=1 Tax=Stylophora pistillata TaxID=50429 RepID=UPI000C0393AF|nr:gamma-aminobutyric acid receptor subunit beta-1-like isoform X1 [Stylophora pistillata]